MGQAILRTVVHVWLEALPRTSVKHPLCPPSRTASEKEEERERDAEGSYERTERDADNGPNVRTMGLRRRWRCSAATGPSRERRGVGKGYSYGGRRDRARRSRTRMVLGILRFGR